MTIIVVFVFVFMAEQSSFARKSFDTPIYGFCDAINAIGYAIHRSRSHKAVIRVYDDAGNIVETHEHAGELKEP